MPDHAAAPVVDGESPVEATGLRVRALQLLTRRDYCRAELRIKLAAEAESAEQLDAVLDTLQEDRLLSDPRYAAQRVAARAGRYGNTRLRQELRQKGVGDEDIAAALPQGGDESERCRTVWARKFGVLPHSAEERARQMRFLQYRGFSGETIRQVISGADE
ncbi:recombination regulator RecX [Azonexus sp.]|jgi:regulatory protein|uniref:recombination regulator RecX n=1 Tax=Azonexus sp. TaxID=1872668 RepID=UPI0028312B8A|nr:recombination regulator RecX [Azonexus sp.]MDR1995599.1 recombination regulator RecX [Azonexus sp.]